MTCSLTFLALSLLVQMTTQLLAANHEIRKESWAEMSKGAV